MEANNKTVKLPMEQLIGVVQLQLAQRGSASLVVTGNSMWPLFRHMRDQVMLSPPVTCGKGDIVLYQRSNGQYVLHRIVKKEIETSICCGDNQWEKETIQNGWILAVVTDFYRKGKLYSVTSKGYRLYKWVWMGLFPVRRGILLPVRICSRLKNKFLGGKI
ncbi:MAG: S24/S26 family peptidase [Oscillospiraceae bacterium]|nr:S24/S26 family peptidase [Oscillospiraceae bacterium]